MPSATYAEPPLDAIPRPANAAFQALIKAELVQLSLDEFIPADTSQMKYVVSGMRFEAPKHTNGETAPRNRRRTRVAHH